MTKKILLCMAAVAMMLVTCAYAAEEDSDVLDVPETDESVLVPSESDPDADPESVDPVDTDPSGADTDESSEYTDESLVLTEEEPETTPDPTDTPEPTAISEAIYSPAINEDGVPASLGDDMDTDVTPTPEPTPDQDVMTVEEETLDTLGKIYGLMIFFTVVLLCFFSYKFMRIFF